MDWKEIEENFKPFSWTCPFCNHVATITESNIDIHRVNFTIGNKEGPKVIYICFIVCPNLECKKFTFTVSIYNATRPSPAPPNPTDMMKEWNLIPPSTAKVFPEYVPKPIRDDYEEACLIKDLSPKASATLARRCLQGMIRDFWRVAKPKLSQEISEIKDKVDPQTWEAIDSIRTIGNIGAHMEEDINLIIDVEPYEADLLIRVIEYLMKEWYINRQEREERFKSIVEVAKKKKEALKGAARKTTK
jgi:hypothetical protein